MLIVRTDGTQFLPIATQTEDQEQLDLIASQSIPQLTLATHTDFEQVAAPAV